jgi:hypothetical protein
MDISNFKQAMAILGSGTSPSYHLGSSPTLVAKPWSAQNLSSRGQDTPSPASSCYNEGNYCLTFLLLFFRSFQKFSEVFGIGIGRYGRGGGCMKNKTQLNFFEEL